MNVQNSKKVQANERAKEEKKKKQTEENGWFQILNTECYNECIVHFDAVTHEMVPFME